MEAAGLGSGRPVFLQMMSVFADLSVLDLWLPLAMGCATVIAPAEQMKDVDVVRGLIARHRVACMTTVPSMFQVWRSAVDGLRMSCSMLPGAVLVS